MVLIKNGKEEIVYLLTKVIEKFQHETGSEVVQNTNRKNYEGIAVFLSDISNKLPENHTNWETEEYTARKGDDQLDYPYRKFDITGGQIKDALNGIVNNPRPYLIDACYVYLYGVGRKGFEKNPVDPFLVEGQGEAAPAAALAPGSKDQDLESQIKKLESGNQQKKQKIMMLAGLVLLLIAASCFLYVQKNKSEKELAVLKQDMSLLPYQPSQAEIDSLEGIWLCYTGSPQARISYSDRFHKVVSNLIEITYKNGYFIYNRYGASFDHTGYMQFESPGIVSIYSRIKNKTGAIESPRHSLMNIYSGTHYIPAISASWNFDIGDKNKIVGIREVYQKIGKGGQVHEILNQVENASCQCKIINWEKPDNTLQVFHLKNHPLETVMPAEIQALIDEKSILLNQPDSTVILSQPKNKDK
ncbi:hypothetical protein ACFS6H_05610 [Terrimonas rubra]|uniref:Uncharacterized protein n=1 Tax=Terrimonas rubra TaxID=1035890 RepID=A0ABW6A356_9BACT